MKEARSCSKAAEKTEESVQTTDIKRDSAVASWLRELTKSPLMRDGDYFERLRGSVESSAPVCTQCG
jgi:hypothetical protein